MELGILLLRQLYGEGDTITRHLSCTPVSEYAKQWLTFIYVLVCLAKLQDRVDPNYKISIRSLRYKENGEV